METTTFVQKERVKSFIICFIFNPNFAGRNYDKVVDYLSELLKKYGGQLNKVYIFGERKFAYKIEHQQMGLYVFVDCAIVNKQVKLFRRDLELSKDVVLRFLILQKEKALKVINLSDLSEYKKEEPVKEEGERNVATQ
jgi:ribosomal protein S6